jgi:hypothetical protein
MKFNGLKINEIAAPISKGEKNVYVAVGMCL